MIIIDAYNFLYFRYDEINIDIINAFLKKIIFYSNNSKNKIKIVFDGVFFKNSFLSQYGLIELFFSENDADSLIIKIIEKSPSKTYTLITADRGIINSILKKKSCKLIKPNMFWQEIDYINNEKINEIKLKKLKKTILKKTSEYDDILLDNLFIKYLK